MAKDRILSMDEQAKPIDFDEATSEQRKEQIKQDKQKADQIADEAQLLAKQLEHLKEFDKAYAEHEMADRFKNI